MCRSDKILAGLLQHIMKEYIRYIWELLLLNKEWVFSGVGVGVILAVRSSIYTLYCKYLKQKQKNNDLRLVDVYLDDTNALIDIKLRNVGRKVCFVKEANVKVLKVGRLKNPYQTNYVLIPITKNYDINFIGHKFINIKVSQAIQPDEVDRFSFTFIEKSKGNPFIPSLFYIIIELIFNETNEKIESDPLLFVVNNDRAIAGHFNNQLGEDRLIKYYNRCIVKKFNELTGIKSDSFNILYESIVVRDEPFCGFIKYFNAYSGSRGPSPHNT